jgi:hypothetical protein
VSAEERLAGPKMKADRAKFHIENIKAEIGAFLATNPYRFGTKNDAQTGKLVYYMTQVDPVPIRIVAVIGDALCNLRGALDHLAQQFFLVGSPGKAIAGHISFPIYDNATEYATESPRKVKGMRQDAKNFIEASQPYHGGDKEFLLRLNKLCNIDKHRKLLAAGGGHIAADIGADVSQRFNEAFPGKFPKFDISLVFGVADLMCPLKVGDILFTGAVGDKPNDKMRQFFCVSLNESKVLPAQPVDVLLTDFSNGIDRILNLALPLLV